jgi:hypothetical protein
MEHLIAIHHRHAPRRHRLACGRCHFRRCRTIHNPTRQDCRIRWILTANPFFHSKEPGGGRDRESKLHGR